MPDPLYGLSADDVTTLREIARAYRGGENAPRPRHQRKKPHFREKVIYFGKTDEEIGADEEGTVSRWQWNGSSAYEDTGDNDECRCFLLTSTDVIAANTRVIYAPAGAGFEIIAAACEADA